jgi:hypothetical protein
MSKLAAAVSAFVEQLESYESRLDALTAKVHALEAQLVTATTRRSAAIGAGRKALIRLTAMLERRPVPTPLLTADELSG